MFLHYNQPLVDEGPPSFTRTRGIHEKKSLYPRNGVMIRAGSGCLVFCWPVSCRNRHSKPMDVYATLP